MKKQFWIFLLTIPFFLSACNQVEEENQEMITKELPMRWAPATCTIDDEFGIPIAEGTKCKYDQDGGCKWPTKCKKRVWSFVEFAIENTPGLTTENWGEEFELRGYEIQLMLWREDPYDYYHPDSIPQDTIQ